MQYFRTKPFIMVGLFSLLLMIVAGCEGLNQSKDKPTAPEIMDDNTELSAFDESSIVWDLDLQENETISDSLPVLANAWWWYVNWDIWYRAHRDIGHNVDMECKPWASTIVHDVTGFWLPSTQSNGYYLNSGHVQMIVDGHTVGGGTIERGIGVGNIIQMRIKTRRYTGPHTAIFYHYVTRNGLPGMYWVDSNWFTDTYPEYVYVHFVSFDWFRRYVGTEYSVYQANNW